MRSQRLPRWKSWRRSLRFRVALGIALPLVLVLASGSLLHYWRARQMLDEQIQLTALQLGDTMLGSLRHAMLANDSDLQAQIVGDVGQMDSVHRVVVVNAAGRVQADSLGEELGATWPSEQLGCEECHRFPAGSLPRVAKLAAATGALRISTPIGNDASCSGCHSPEEPHLGMLLVDVSIIDAQKHLVDGLRVDLAVAAGGTVLVTLGLSLLMHRLVVRRVEALRRPLTEFAAGDFAHRLPVPALPADELDELAIVFNQMADELQQQARKQEERTDLRQRAIVEERERIARELHDGMAQLLAYVNTKVMAVRLMLKKGQIDSANRHLLQLEVAARELFVDVRQAVLGLRTAGQIGDGLAAMVKGFATQFSQLSDVPVEVLIAPEVEALDLSAESELQLLRIIQEALTNVRKHASASGAQVSLQVSDSTLHLMITDDGHGFDIARVQSEPHQRFGLSTMRERAEAIDADFDLHSEPGIGTRVSLRLPIGES